MTENDGHEMLVARCKALEQIALKYVTLYSVAFAYEESEQTYKKQIEREVERIAPGCGHIQR